MTDEELANYLGLDQQTLVILPLITPEHRQVLAKMRQIEIDDAHHPHCDDDSVVNEVRRHTAFWRKFALPILLKRAQSKQA